VGLTYFFRDLQTLELIRDQALPTLNSYQRISIWDAGCARGPEPYTLALLLRETLGEAGYGKVSITASDLDPTGKFCGIVTEAIYGRDEVDRVPPEILERHFKPVDGGDRYQVSAEVRSAVHFTQHDLLALKPVGQGFGLILCKNVLLHFTEEERRNVMRMFYEALIPGGYFATEQTQKLPADLQMLFEPVVSHAQLYRKRGGA